jgi:thiol-disulfide isomerase/thioredoxin
MEITMRTSLYFILLILGSLTSLSAAEQDYHISFKVEGISKDTALLAYNYGDKKFISDSIIFTNGFGAIKGKKDYPSGIYLVVFPSLGNMYFELVLNKENAFEMSTSTADFIQNMKVKNSAENQLFYEDVRFMISKGKEMEELRKAYGEAEEGSDRQKEILEQNKAINAVIKKQREAYANMQPHLLYSKLLNLMAEVDVPEAPLMENGEPQPNFAYYYTRDHYFDKVDFSDPGLIRTPVLLPKIMRFLDDLVVPVPDSIKIWAENIVEMARANDDVYRVVLSEILNKYAKSNIMGQEAIYVHLVDKYYSAGKAPWVDEETLTKMKDRSDALRPTIIGSKAPDMNVYGLDGRMINLYKSISNNRYTILAFWNSECSHCKKEIPEIKRVLEDSLQGFGVGVFSVSTEVEKEYVEKFVLEKEISGWINGYDPTGKAPFRRLYDLVATPVVIVLDADKTIIAKKVAVKDLKFIIESHDAFLKRKAEK